jgi:hypothetical protein
MPHRLHSLIQAPHLPFAGACAVAWLSTFAGCAPPEPLQVEVPSVDPCPTGGCTEVEEPVWEDVEEPEVVLTPFTLDELTPGDLQVSEVHRVPASCEPTEAQYIELFNPLDRPIDLTGLQLSDRDRLIEVPDAPMLSPGAHVVLGAGTNTACFGNSLPTDATYAEPLNLDEDAILTLVTPDGNILDDVRIAELPNVPGAAAVRSAETLAGDRRVLPRWCHATTAILPGNHELPDLGSPGAGNGICPGAFEGEVVSVHLLGPGDLVITEAMVEPMACPDHRAEYIEVYNTTGAAVDLAGLSLRVDGRNDLVTESRIIAPGAWAIAEFSTTGGIVASCYVGVLDDFTFVAGKMLDEGTRIELLNVQGLIDAVDLRNLATVPGASLQLDFDHLDATSNDDPSKWCHSGEEFVGSRGDLGSPHAENVRCP